MNVVGWIDDLRCDLCGCGYGVRIDNVAVQDRFCRGQTLGSITDTDHANMGVRRTARRVEVIESRYSSKREVTATAGEFLKTPPPRWRPRWKVDLRDEFVRRQHGGEWAEEE